MRSAGKCERKKGRIMSVSDHALGGQETVVSIDTTPIECSLSDLGEVRLEMVSGSSLESFWNVLVRTYHYLGHQRMFGRRLKYLAVACPVELLKPCLDGFLFFANRQVKNSPNRTENWAIGSCPKKWRRSSEHFSSMGFNLKVHRDSGFSNR